MDKSLSIGVVVGATLAASFPGAISGAKQQINTLGAAIKDLSGKRGLIERFEKDQVAIEKTRLKLSQAQKEVLRVKAALRKDSKNSGLAKDLEVAQRQSEKLSTALEKQRDNLQKSQRAMVNSGVSVKDVAHEYTRLGREIERTEAKYARLKKRMSQRDAAKGRVMDMRGEMLGAAGLLYGAGSLVGEAMDFGRSATRLSTVMNAENVGKELAKSRRHALAYARKSLANETDLLNIEYALNSAGLDAATARAGSEIVSKVSTITEGAAEQVGEVVATTFNNLGGALEGSTVERLQRIGDVLTKTQFKFQLRDFSQLGESFKMATPALAQYNVNLEQGATLLGALNSAGLQGSMAGTALTATFRNLSKASEEFGFDMSRGFDGGLDVIATLQAMSDAIGGFDNMEQSTIDDLQRVFGDEGIRMVSLLGPKLHELSEAQKDVADSSRGIVDASYQKFMDDGRGQLTLFTSNVRTLGLAFAGTLLPAVNAVLRPITGMVGHIGIFVEKYPAVSKFITGAVVGFTLFKGALMASAAAQWAFNAAMMANPIGLIVAALGGAAALIVHYWQPITGFFSSMWSGIKSLFSQGVGFLTKIWERSPVGLLFKAGQKLAGFIGDLFGDDDDPQPGVDDQLPGDSRSDSGVKVGASMSPRSQRQRANVSPAGLAAEIASAQPAQQAVNQSTSISAPITIHATPGMDEQAVAQIVTDHLTEQQRRAEARQRGNLYD
jgi:TP901 family phage tail tape measure protein